MGTTIIDDFETGTLDSAWSNPSGDYSVDTSTAYEGTYGLLHSGASASYCYSNEGDGLPAYFSKGTTLNVWKYSNWSSFRIEVIYGLLGDPSGSGDYYGALWDPSNNQISLNVVEGGTESYDYTASASGSTSDTWYDFQIQWANDDTHTITVTNEAGTEVASLTATDATHAGNAGIGTWWSTHQDTYGSDLWRVTTSTVPVTGNVALDDGTVLEGATVVGINDTQGIVEDVTTTDANGDYTLNMTPGETAHVTMEYDDGTNQYNAESKPFVVVTE